MKDDGKTRIIGYHHFRKLPTARHGLAIAVLFVVLILIAVFLQQAGFWPESWNSSFDGTGE
ncbi:hypothetical protein [Nitratireductor sp. XY-223]|uniref:hypothetical protein n=1 Tax=Nitratireductor sp. XY-223 TaxID=2561926 RepID=UPI0010A9F49B|nr:hypothetical protein [Nitratireductor sp. XY-223]